jgi:adenosylcobinamide-GDP ribazoletransferase
MAPSGGLRGAGSALGSLRVAFAFLTRLPLPSVETSDRDLARSLAFFPLAGTALGALLSLLAWLASGHLPPYLTAVGVVAVLALATGGLHLDGLGDVFDGLGGGAGERERTLAIMRDSRIGSAGACAIALALIAKVVCCAELVARGDLRALVAFPAIARWAVVPLVTMFPYARAEGIGRPFAGGARPLDLGWATIATLPVVIYAGSPGFAPLVAAAGAALAVAAWMQRRLGGLTGDVYGAAIEIAEIACLTARIVAASAPTH